MRPFPTRQRAFVGAHAFPKWVQHPFARIASPTRIHTLLSSIAGQPCSGIRGEGSSPQDGAGRGSLFGKKISFPRQPSASTDEALARRSQKHRCPAPLSLTGRLFTYQPDIHTQSAPSESSALFTGGSPAGRPSKAAKYMPKDASDPVKRTGTHYLQAGR